MCFHYSLKLKIENKDKFINSVIRCRATAVLSLLLSNSKHISPDGAINYSVLYKEHKALSLDYISTVILVKNEKARGAL